MPIKLLWGVLLLQTFVSGETHPGQNARIHPDAGLNVMELITKHGYPVERHWVETEDGYILGMHRIPHGLHNAQEPNKPVVLIVHGLLSSSADWVNNGEKSFGFLLADLGYDVWLGNARGNTWSRNHTTLDPDEDDDFWLFSWHHVGYYDLPAKIDYVTNTTGQERIFYVGHSQGTTSFYVMSAERPEYNDRIRLMVSFAPVAYMSHLENPFFKLLAQFHNALELLGQLIGLHEFRPHDDLKAILASENCDTSKYNELCSNILFLIAGFDSEQLDKSMVPVIVSNVPAGASVKNVLHYAQGIKSGHFRSYDYGLIGNLNNYGQITPPRYDTSKITATVALFYADNDWLSAVEDVEQLYSELPNVALKHRVDFEKFNHIDYLWAVDVIPLLYSKVFDLMENY